MMKTRLSAIAADAARRNAQAKNADVDRMLHRSMRALLPFDNPKTLTMINQAGRADSWPKSAFCDLDGIPRAGPWWPHERFPRHLWHLPRDYELAIRWLRPSFLTRDHWTPGRQCPRLSRSHSVAAGVFANVRAGGDTDKKYNCSAAFRFEVPDRICGPRDRNFKSAALPTGYPWNCASTIR